MVYVNDHDHLLFFTAEGRAYSVRAYDVPEGGRTSVGTAIAQVGARIRRCLVFFFWASIRVFLVCASAGRS